MEMIDKGQENVKNMKPGVLYYPVDHYFPVIDFVFIKEEQTGQNKRFCVQVIFGKTHDKSVPAYKKLFQHLGLKETETDKVEINILCCKQDVDEYAQN